MKKMLLQDGLQAQMSAPPEKRLLINSITIVKILKTVKLYKPILYIRNKILYIRNKKRKFLEKRFPTLKLKRAVRKMTKYCFLEKEGWNASILKGMPVDREGKHLPWITYGAIYFLMERILKEHSVFEYGSGNSTLWFAERAGRIISIEHDKYWYQKLGEKTANLSNVEYKLLDLASGDYESEILNYNSEFDILFIDGRNRVKCAKTSLKALNDKGVIIWDDTSRERYQEGYDYLKANGFKRLDFRGLSPGKGEAKSTSIFYREENCLDI